MSEAAQGASEERLAGQALSPARALYAGFRQPVVWILLLIALFTTISGKPLDGFLMLTVATLLMWDATRARAAQYAGPAARAGATAPGPHRSRPRASRRQVAAGLAWVAAGLAYAGVVGSFRRYSWPATVSVVALGCLAVAAGWQGPLRRRAALTGRALRRAWVWGLVLVAGGLWELSSLVQQPHLTTDSYAHPTISALSDPLLASHPGRSVALGAWLLIGYFLAGR